MNKLEKNSYKIIKTLLCAVLCAALLSGAAKVRSFGSEMSDIALGIIGMTAPVKYISALRGEYNADSPVSHSVRKATFSGFGSGRVAQTEALTQVSEDVADIMLEAQVLYSDMSKDGDIKEVLFSAKNANTVFESVAVSNKTSSHSVNIKALLKNELSLEEVKGDEPCILIYHTHATEGFELLDKGWYSDSYNSRTKDTAKSIVRVGEELAGVLAANGFNVIHDKTIHDTSYNGSYTRSAKTVSAYLEKYPSIILSIDIHRDAIHYDDGTKAKPTAVINGKKAAQVMIIAGCEDGSIDDFPNWMDNLIFSLKLQKASEEQFPGIMRPVFFCERIYNMDMTRYSMLLEFGTDANTLDEAVYSGRLIGTALSDMLRDEMGE